MIKRDKEKNIGRKSWGNRMRRTVLPGDESCQRGLQRQCSVSHISPLATIIDHELLEEWIYYYILHTQHNV